MDIDPTAAKRSRAHQRYYLKDGTAVIGVTTALNLLAKPALVPWANALGLAGIKVSDYVDALATIGTIAHDLILAHHQGRTYEPDGQAPDLIDRAETCLIKYFQWEDGKEILPLLCEAQLVSEAHRYGGTLDLYCKLNGVRTLVDYKSGKAIYPEYSYQVAAYRQLLEENGYKVDQVRILQIGRNEDEGFSEKVLSDTNRELKIFLLCKELYDLKAGR